MAIAHRIYVQTDYVLASLHEQAAVKPRPVQGVQTFTNVPSSDPPPNHDALLTHAGIGGTLDFYAHLHSLTLTLMLIKTQSTICWQSRSI